MVAMDTVDGNEPTEVLDLSQLRPGTMVGEYCIEDLIGEGGMGRVYAAAHPVIGKRAAIKVLRPELSANQDAITRFVQEARLVNEIGSPNIVDIFAFGALPDQRCYFVMELLRGESLRDRLRRESKLPLADALVILETITFPLEAAHEHGVVHRDLKPDNVFLVRSKGDRPLVKLLDFGIAKLVDPQRPQHTQTGIMLGTPAYISPEQARGEGVDHRTDIYALGAMAFELVTGEVVFPATNAADMIAMHLFQQPRSALVLDATIPPPLAALIARMLAKDPAARPTLDRVRQELRTGNASMHTTTIHATPLPIQHFTPYPTMDPRPRSHTRVVVIAMTAAIVLGVGIAVLASLPARDESTPVPASDHPSVPTTSATTGAPAAAPELPASPPDASPPDPEEASPPVTSVAKPPPIKRIPKRMPVRHGGSATPTKPPAPDPDAPM
ncbi:MAG: serine/threonine-protein kinase [Kofleriaceae bacterium]